MCQTSCTKTMGIFEKSKEGHCCWSGRRGGLGINLEKYAGATYTGLYDHDKKFSFYSKCSGKPLREFKQGSNIISN